jgi:glycosyltransferase involved in cell wall biosynthesis
MTKIKIYIDASGLIDPDYITRGIGRHSVCVLKYLKEFIKFPCEVIALLNGISSVTLPKLPKSIQFLFDRVAIAIDDSFEPSIFFQFSPLTSDQAKFFPLLNNPKILSCSIFYDLIPFLYPERYLPTSLCKLEFLTRMSLVKCYDLIFPISQYSADNLKDILGISEGKVFVAGACVDDRFNIAREQNYTSRLLSKHPPLSYFLVVGGGDIRKNPEVAVVSHANSSYIPNFPDLIIAGNYPDCYKNNLLALHKNNGGDSKKIFFMRDISDKDMPYVYKNAIAVICPSRIEGFSLPVAEASIMNTPVLSSNCAAQAELLKDEDVLFEPDNHVRLIYLMKKISQDEQWRQEVIKKQSGIGPRFLDLEVAKRIWPVVERFWNNKKKIVVKRKSACSKPTIAVVSPWPDDLSGVADYTKKFVSVLSKRAIVDVYTDATNIEKTPAVRHFRPISAIPYISPEYNKVVSVIGNSHFHSKILDLVLSFGGVCISHDVRLLGLYNLLIGYEGSAKLASKELGYKISTKTIDAWFHDESLIKARFLLDLVKASSTFIVHSLPLKNLLASGNVKYIPMAPFNELPSTEDLTLESRSNIRKSFNLKNNKVIITSFGFVDFNTKASDKILFVIKEIIDQGIDAEILFVAYSIDQGSKNGLTKIAVELGIEDRLHFYEAEDGIDRYKDLLLITDFAVQLRTYVMGSLSGALLDCIVYGVPTITNKDMAIAMNSPDYVHVVPDLINTKLIAKELIKAYKKGEHLNRLRNSREEYINKYSMQNYTEEFLKILKL